MCQLNIGRPFSILMGLMACALWGCATSGQTAGLLGGGLLLGAQAPTTELTQIYYLGVFDPHQQLPPQVYRVTVHGQSSFLGITKFASGWLPAAMIDSLSSRVSFQANGQEVTVSKPSQDTTVSLSTGRRLMLFGPQGFREAPADKRLVILMGTDPSKVFQGIDNALGLAAPLAAEVAKNATTQPSTQPSVQSLVNVSTEQARLRDLQSDLEVGP